MQYKIPVQIENEDKIFLNLSIRQLTIIMIGGGIGYSVFKSLEKSAGAEVALFPTVIIVGFSILVAVFRHSEMTFLPFALNLVRLNLNVGSRVWSRGVDSYSHLQIGYVRQYNQVESKVVTKHAGDAYDTIEDKLNKI